MPDDLIPIEHKLRPQDIGDDTILLIRGGPLSSEKLVEHAERQMRDFSLRGAPMASISVDGLVAGWTVELVLRERLWSRSQFATATAGAVRERGSRCFRPTMHRTSMSSSSRRRLPRLADC